MKFLKARKKKSGERAFVFQLSKREKEYLLFTLSIYTLMDIDLKPLSRSGGVDEEEQQLLRESMVDLRRSRGKKLNAFLEKSPFKTKTPGCQLVLSGEEIEWLLQVLNEIRIGCWMNLGRPELGKPEEGSQFKSEESRNWMFMELSGFFQMNLLQAFGE